MAVVSASSNFRHVNQFTMKCTSAGHKAQFATTAISLFTELHILFPLQLMCPCFEPVASILLLPSIFLLFLSPFPLSLSPLPFLPPSSFSLSSPSSSCQPSPTPSSFPTSQLLPLGWSPSSSSSLQLQLLHSLYLSLRQLPLPFLSHPYLMLLLQAGMMCQTKISLLLFPKLGHPRYKGDIHGSVCGCMYIGGSVCRKEDFTQPKRSLTHDSALKLVMSYCVVQRVCVSESVGRGEVGWFTLRVLCVQMVAAGKKLSSQHNSLVQIDATLTL